jgi:hypothetical protein
MIATLIAEVVLLPLKAIGLTFVFGYLIFCMGLKACEVVKRWTK